MWSFSPVEIRKTTKPVSITGYTQFGVTVNASASPQPNTSAKSRISPRLKTAPIKAELVSTSDETPKKVRRILALIRVLLASFYDVFKALPNCRILAKDGGIFFLVAWDGVDLGFDEENNLTVSFTSTGGKEEIDDEVN